jgi:hypothetical protein
MVAHHRHSPADGVGVAPFSEHKAILVPSLNVKGIAGDARK